ncbi:MAG: SpoIIE family protein phosphatase [bacterium]|nr:SpoIIE family protein phosphatase [bacterium]
MLDYNLAKVDLKGKNILIVDDTPENLRLLVNILKKIDYKVRPVSNGKAALAAVKASLPDLILLDINMPEMDGYEVCKILKSETKTREIPVIFISAMHEAIDKVKAFESGGIDYISKPFHVEEVLERVKTHLKLYLFQKKLENSNELLEDMVEKRTAEVLRLNALKQTFDMELKISQHIQTSMLPKQDKFKDAIPGINFTAFTNPAKRLGGDFYDYFVLDDSTMFFCLGDVSGKGIPAAMFMAIVMTLIKVEAKRNILPHEIIENVNSFVFEENDTCMFASVICGIINLDTGLIKFCNAGHTAPFILNKEKSKFLPLKKETVVGVLKAEKGDYTTEEIILAKDEKLYLYSDGVTEAINPDKTQYTKDSIVSFFNSLPKGFDDKKIIDVMRDDLSKFTKSEPQADDITMMLISFNNT